MRAMCGVSHSGHDSCTTPGVFQNPLLEARNRARALGPKRVLVVDDESDPRELVAHVLEASGLCVTAAESAEEAIKAMLAQPVVLVVSDVGMPEMDGHAFVRRIRSSSLWSMVPVIAVSGFVQPEDRRRALDAGFNAHFAKPCDAAALLSAIVRLLAPK